VYANQRLSLDEEGWPMEEKPRLQTGGNPAVRHYRGASETVTLVVSQTREWEPSTSCRGPGGALQLPSARPSSIPTPTETGSNKLGRTYGQWRQSSTLQDTAYHLMVIRFLGSAKQIMLALSVKRRRALVAANPIEE
jgi:hypothetical protein